MQCYILLPIIYKKKNKSMITSGYQKLRPKLKSQRKIMLEQLVFTQMKESLSGTIPDQVQNTKNFLLRVGPARSRRVVFNVQNNLLNFLKGKQMPAVREKQHHFISSEAPKTILNQQQQNNDKNVRQARQKPEKTTQKCITVETQGALVKRFISHVRFPSRERRNPITALTSRLNQTYSSLGHLRKRSENNFNLIMHS